MEHSTPTGPSKTATRLLLAQIVLPLVSVLALIAAALWSQPSALRDPASPPAAVSAAAAVQPWHASALYWLGGTLTLGSVVTMMLALRTASNRPIVDSVENVRTTIMREMQRLQQSAEDRADAADERFEAEIEALRAESRMRMDAFEHRLERAEKEMGNTSTALREITASLASQRVAQDGMNQRLNEIARQQQEQTKIIIDAVRNAGRAGA